jgi:hypothetical protein
VVLAILISSEFPSQVVIGLVFWVLEIVFSVRRCLPDVNDGVGDWLLGDEIGDGAVHECYSATFGNGILHDAAAERTEWSVGAPEWAENRGGSGDLAGFGHDCVGNLVDDAVRCVSFDCRAGLSLARLTILDREHLILCGLHF